MAHVSDYSIITDDPFVLTSAATSNLHEFTFSLDSPIVDSRSILVWSMGPVLPATGFKFNIKLNGTQVFVFTINSDTVFHTLHTIIGRNILKAKNNILQFKSLTQNNGLIQVDDIVIWYQHNV